MRTLLKVTACAVSALAMTAAFATTATNSKNAATSANATTTKSDFILLYNKPTHGKVVKRLAPNLRLIPIYRDGNWMKVGNPANGNVGWINLVQYQKARYNYYQPDIQTLYVHIDDKTSGKPTLNVVAYKNGKKLTDKDALNLYKKLRKQEAVQFRNMQRMTYSMQQMMDQDFMNAQTMFDSSWVNPPMMAPIILMPVPQKPNMNSAPNQQAPTKAPAKKSNTI